MEGLRLVLVLNTDFGINGKKVFRQEAFYNSILKKHFEKDSISKQKLLRNIHHPTAMISLYAPSFNLRSVSAVTLPKLYITIPILSAYFAPEYRRLISKNAIIL